MIAYGVKRKDKGCCPGHDKYPDLHGRYRNKKARLRPAKKRARREALDG